MIAKTLSDFAQAEASILLYEKFGYPVFISLEGLSIGGSIKFTAALRILEDLERQYGDKLQNMTIIESSSGNLAISLAILCKPKGYRLAIVMDPNAPSFVEKFLRLYDVELIFVNTRDENGGYLGSRIAKVKELLQTGYYAWTNQYNNQANPDAHYTITAPKIFKQVPDANYLFLGAGTCGTLQGVSRFFKEHAPNTKIIAVDVEGSVALSNAMPNEICGNHGNLPSRILPGMGASQPSYHAHSAQYDDKILISEKDTIKTLHQILTHTGILFGGSTGTVLCGIRNYFAKMATLPQKVICIAPDFGEKYIDHYLKLGWPISTPLTNYHTDDYHSNNCHALDDYNDISHEIMSHKGGL